MSELLSSVIKLGRKTGQAIKPFFSKVDPEIKADGSWLTEADTLAHDILFDELPKIVDLPVLSEELSKSQQQRIIDTSSKGFWCVDPLDGTSNFTQGIPYYCVSIALVESGIVKLGVVYDPNRDECFNACDDKPSCIDDKPIHVKEDTELQDAMALIDLKRLTKPIRKELVANIPYRSQRNFGASALDICWIAADRCQLYLHGQQQLWDYAAASKILGNAAGRIETFEQEPVFQNDLIAKRIIATSNTLLIKPWREYLETIGIHSQG